MRHQRLRVVATVQFPNGFRDEGGVVLSSFKAAVAVALREAHAKHFGRTAWPLEVNVSTSWDIREEVA